MFWNARTFRPASGSRGVASRLGRWALLATLLAAAAPRPAVGRGEVGLTIVDPPGAAIEIERLGADTPETAVGGGPPLMPGDLLSCSVEGVAVELACPPDSANTYSLASPFRVVVGVPSSGSCHLDLLSGSVGVLAEEATEVTAGGVEIRSVSTWYQVRVERSSAGVEQEVDAFDDVVEVDVGESVTQLSGAGLTIAGGAVRRAREISPAAIERSAAVYSRLELRKAELAGVAIPDRARARKDLEVGYYEVMQAPRDQDKRLRLAETQLRYQVERKAVYHLEQAEAVDPERFRAHTVNWTTIPLGELTPRQQEYVERKMLAPAALQPTAVDPSALQPSSMRVMTVDPSALDLARIERGEIEAAIESLARRVGAGEGGSRDYYGLSRGFLKLEQTDRAAAYAKEALAAAERDGRLVEEELAWLEDVLRRAAELRRSDG